MQTVCIHTPRPTTSALPGSLWGPPQDLGSSLGWAVCLRSASGGLAVPLPAPVPLLSPGLSAPLPESDFLCLLPPAPPCVSLPQQDLLCPFEPVCLFLISVWGVSGCVHLSICIHPGACESLSLPTVSESLSSLTAPLPVYHSLIPFLSPPVVCPCAVSSACLSLFGIVSLPISVSPPAIHPIPLYV